MKRRLVLLAGMTIAAASGSSPASPPAASAAKRSSVNAIYAQSLVNEIMLAHPELMLMGLHAVPPGSAKEVIVAASVDKIGEPDSTGDNQVRTSGATILEHHLKWGFTYGSVLTPINDASGRVVGGAALGFIYTGRPDDWQNFLRLAQEIKAELALKLPDGAALLRPVAQLTPLLAADRRVRLGNAASGREGLVIDQSGRKLLLPRRADNLVDLADLDTGALLGQIKAPAPAFVAVDSAGGRYWVSEPEAGRIAVIDRLTLKETGSFPLNGPIASIVFDEARRRAFVVHGTTLTVIKADELAAIAAVEIPAGAEQLVYDLPTDRLYLSLPLTNEVLVLDPMTAQPLAHWTSSPATRPGAMALDSARGLLFLAGTNGRLVKIRLADGAVVRAVAIVERTGQIAFDPSSRRIYCAGPEDMTIAQDMKSNGLRLIGSVQTSPQALSVAVDARTHAVWSKWAAGGETYLQSWQLP